jgi:inner membrane protease ATP23
MVYSAWCTVTSEEVISGTEQPRNANSESPPVKSKNEKDEISNPVNWGYDLYPERRGEKYKPSWTKVIFRGEGKENLDKLRCEENVYNCVKNST